VIIEQGERMATPAAAAREVALEIHLPEFIGRRALKAHVRAVPLGQSRAGGTHREEDAGKGTDLKPLLATPGKVLYADVGHGFGFHPDAKGLMSRWPDRFHEWLTVKGLLAAKP